MANCPGTARISSNMVPYRLPSYLYYHVVPNPILITKAPIVPRNSLALTFLVTVDEMRLEPVGP